MENKKKLIIIVSAIGAAIVAAVLILMLVCFHSWNDATCDAPMTCDKCGKTKGEILQHEWVEATCKEAKHCMLCGLPDGEPLAHKWIEATCETAKTCSVCSTVEGDPIGHAVKDWKITKETSCSAEGERTGTCDRCKKECVEKIYKLPHTKSDWQIKKDFIINSDGTITAGSEVIVCVVCKTELETREYTAELTISQKNAAICAYDEINFWHCGPDFLIHTILADFEGYPIEDAKLIVKHMSIDWDEQAILYAREHAEGSSRSNLIKEMTYYGFSKTQIGEALKHVGY